MLSPPVPGGNLIEEAAAGNIAATVEIPGAAVRETDGPDQAKADDHGHKVTEEAFMKLTHFLPSQAFRYYVSYYTPKLTICQIYLCSFLSQ